MQQFVNLVGTLNTMSEPIIGNVNNPTVIYEPGKSAYDLAVEKGFEGTEEEYLASLKGEQGIQGEQGVQGEKGFSPIADFQQTETGVILNITDETGTKTAELKNGIDGINGEKGDAGETAYEAAQKGGFNGSQEDFYLNLASIGNINSVLDAINGEVI